MNPSVVRRLNPLLLLLMLAVMLDTCVSAVRSSPRAFRVVAGQETVISGKLDGAVFPSPVKGNIFSENKIKDPVLLAGLLRAEPTVSPLFSVRFLERNGRIWRAVLRAHPDAQPGDYALYVLQPNEQPESQPIYTVHIFPDTAAKDRAAPSFSMRFLGIPPWWIGLGLVPVVAAMLAASWQATRSEERRLRRLGIGAIYKLARKKDRWEMIAGLGTADGIGPGERVALLSRDFQPITDFCIDSVHPVHFTAELGLAVPVTPNCYVSRLGGERPPASGTGESDGGP
ncbi:MAG: hypothetical protein ABIL58_20605 [Pseudomonadota bacterium]